jgi:hypothetical protein
LGSARAKTRVLLRRWKISNNNSKRPSMVLLRFAGQGRKVQTFQRMGKFRVTKDSTLVPSKLSKKNAANRGSFSRTSPRKARDGATRIGTTRESLGGFGPILLNGRQYMRNSENKNKSMVS